MKKLILYLFAVLLSTRLLAQDSGNTKQLPGFNSVNDAALVAEQIVKASGLRANFAITEANVPNAEAVLLEGKRYILYNPRFMSLVTRATGTQWAAISVLAHEIGHHLYGQAGSNGQPKMASELEADEFSGYVLEKMGATLTEAQAAMGLLSTTQASLTHPSGADRIRSIANGWKNAGGIETGEEQVYANVQLSSTAEPAALQTDIAAAIYFNANPNGKYYVTKEMNVVSIGNSRTAMIGRLKRSNNTAYPFVIQDDNGYSLYVHSSGAIVSRSGKIVGRIEAVTPGG
ncbi:MAG: hypothetical protein ABI688_07685 [Bacteroidota bacterium]